MENKHNDIEELENTNNSIVFEPIKYSTFIEVKTENKWDYLRGLSLRGLIGFLFLWAIGVVSFIEDINPKE